MLLITRSSFIIVDTIVLFVTWIKTFNQWSELRRLNLGTSISSLLLRDGKHSNINMDSCKLTILDTIGTLYFMWVYYFYTNIKPLNTSYLRALLAMNIAQILTFSNTNFVCSLFICVVVFSLHLSRLTMQTQSYRH